MHIEKHTILDPVETGFGTNPSKPLLSFSTLHNSRSVEAHAHARGQLIYATEGVIKVITPQHVWLVTPTQGIWVPGNEIHELWFNEGAAVRSMILEPAITAALPLHSYAFEISEFFVALLGKIMPLNDRIELLAAELRLIQVLIDEIKVLPPSILQLPVGQDEKVQLVTDSLIRRMPVEIGLEQAASLAGTNTRNFSRLFVAETGMTYADWCTKLKALEGIKRLLAGETIEQVSVDLGYNNIGSFTYDFQKSLGKAPRSYLRNSNGL